MEVRRRRPSREQRIVNAELGIIDDHADADPPTLEEIYGSPERLALAEQMLSARTLKQAITARQAAKEWLQAHPNDPAIVAALQELTVLEGEILAREQASA